LYLLEFYHFLSKFKVFLLEFDDLAFLFPIFLLLLLNFWLLLLVLQMYLFNQLCQLQKFLITMFLLQKIIMKNVFHKGLIINFVKLLKFRFLLIFRFWNLFFVVENSVGLVHLFRVRILVVERNIIKWFILRTYLFRLPTHRHLTFLPTLLILLIPRNNLIQLINMIISLQQLPFQQGNLILLSTYLHHTRILINNRFIRYIRGFSCIIQGRNIFLDEEIGWRQASNHKAKWISANAFL